MGSIEIIEKINFRTMIPERMVSFVNGIHPYYFILFILLLFFLRTEPNGNEEGLMQISKHVYNRNWLPQCFDVSGKMGPRFLYQYPIGFLLQYFSFNLVAVIGVLLLSLLLSFPLSRIYKLLDLSNIEVLLHLPMLYFMHQSFFAGEFIFLNLESKVFAYVFVLLGVYGLLSEKSTLTIVSGIVATYFHIVVGGWFMVYYLLYHLVTHRRFMQTFWLGMLYAAGVTPLLLLMRSMLADNFSNVQSPVELDWIFTYVRQPHHTAVFQSIPYFIRTHADGVLVTFAVFILCVFVFSHFKLVYNQKINRMNILIFGGTALSLVLAYLDRTGVFVKYFPFRMNALFSFLAFLQVVYLIRHGLVREEYLSYVRFGILSVFLITIFPKEVYRLSTKAYKMMTHSQETPFDEMCGYIRDHTPVDAVVMMIRQESTLYDYRELDTEFMLSCFDMDVSFTRKAERKRFVSFKFGSIAPGNIELYDWYLKILAKIEVLKDTHAVCSVREKERIDYLLTDYELKDSPCYRLEHQAKGYFLYEVPGSHNEN